MSYSVKNHILHKDGKPVAQAPTPNVGPVMTPRLVVMHYTGSQNAKGSIAWLRDPRSKVSANLVIDEAGAVTQLAPLNRVTWHAGPSVWKKRSGCNGFSIGIELSNPGPLAKTGAGKFVDGYGKPIPADRALWLRHKAEPAERWWARFPEPQMNAAVEVTRALADAYGIADVAGHEDVAPGRKSDPGPAFHMQGFLARVFGRADAPPPRPVYFDALHEGDSGPRVKQLQTALYAAGAGLKIDGSFGPATKKAVIAHQKKIGVGATGVVGPFLWKALGLKGAA